MYNIGIIGKGFVGSAAAHGFSEAVGYKAGIRIYDKIESRSNATLSETVNESDFLFVSVPTPANDDGSIHLDILDECLNDIDNVNKRNDNIILIRSTIIPGTSRILQKKYKNLNIVFNPEFLTERSALFDFINQSRYVLGGEKEHVRKVSQFFKHRFGESISVIETDYETAELIKYVCNIYFATKISFLNEMKLIAEKINADWSTVLEGYLRDGRIGHSHVNVPGHDGKKGFGGSCFPKDIQALINFAEKNDININTVKGAWQTNLEVRPERDWENLKGRAVAQEKKDLKDKS
tara:strand:+ start:68 stop:946 length:879 start_codon:yes stop_codon:yes gene_type:complete